MYASLVTVIEKDNEENADLAMKQLLEMQKFYRNTFFTLVRSKSSDVPHIRMKYPMAMIDSSASGSQ